MPFGSCDFLPFNLAALSECLPLRPICLVAFLLYGMSYLHVFLANVSGSYMLLLVHSVTITFG